MKIVPEPARLDAQELSELPWNRFTYRLFSLAIAVALMKVHFFRTVRGQTAGLTRDGIMTVLIEKELK